MIEICKEIRQDILRIAKVSGHGHIPSCFSVVEILWAVYSAIRHDPQDSYWEERDIFILSKGHAALAHYCVLAKLGYFDLSRVDSFGAFMSDFGGHANRLKVPGVEVSTGSLGHGIGIAVGMALAFKLQKNNRRVVVLIGDGEANEGSVWEALMVAENLHLNNLIIIYDNNWSQQRGLLIANPAARFQSFGWDTLVIDGHNIKTLKPVMNSGHVKLVVANTTKGYGCRTLVENQYEWHRKSPNDSELKMLMRELDEEAV